MEALKGKTMKNRPGYFTRQRLKRKSLGKSGQGNLEYLMILMVAFLIFKRVKTAAMDKVGDLEGKLGNTYQDAMSDVP